MTHARSRIGRGVTCLGLLLLLPCCATHVANGAGVQGWTEALHARCSGLWERFDLPVNTNRVQRSYSWGGAWVIPNWRTIIDMGTRQPFVMLNSQQMKITGVIDGNDGDVKLIVVDMVKRGTGSSRTVLLRFRSDGTAVIDFERQDGTYFGAHMYRRLDSPGS